jgi:hypothetical protein
MLYRPESFSRVFAFQRYEEDSVFAARLQALVPPGTRAIFLSGSRRLYGTSLYWLLHGYPSWPVLNTDVQTTYLLERRSADFLRGLEDPQLRLVAFDPDGPRFDDFRFDHPGANRHFLREVRCRLASHFDRRDDVIPEVVIWLRKPSAVVHVGDGACTQASH